MVPVPSSSPSLPRPHTARPHASRTSRQSSCSSTSFCGRPPPYKQVLKGEVDFTSPCRGPRLLRRNSRCSFSTSALWPSASRAIRTSASFAKRCFWFSKSVCNSVSFVLDCSRRYESSIVSDWYRPFNCSSSLLSLSCSAFSQLIVLRASEKYANKSWGD